MNLLQFCGSLCLITVLVFSNKTKTVEVYETKFPQNETLFNVKGFDPSELTPTKSKRKHLNPENS